MNIGTMGTLSFSLDKLLPLLPSTIVFGLIFGFTGGTTGYSITLISSMSVIIFAGSAQFVMVLLLIDNEPLIPIVLTAVLINVRHLIYGMVLREKLELTVFKKLIVAYFLVDETFLLTDIADRDQDKNLDLYKIFLVSGASLWFTWNITTILGYYLYLMYGSLIQFPGNFIIAASFVGFLVDHFRKYPMDRKQILGTAMISIFLGFFITSSTLLITTMLSSSFIKLYLERTKDV